MTTILWMLIILGGSVISATARTLTTGISYVSNSDPVAFQNVRRTGAKMVQRTVNWADIAPRIEPVNWRPENPQDPAYNWAPIDLWVMQATQAGLIPLLQIRGAPFWAQQCPGVVAAEPTCKPSPTALAAFATAAARRYSGSFEGLPRVRYWQGLDEPNLSLFFSPQFEGKRPVSPALYRALINSFYFAIKSVNSSNLVLAAGLGPIAVPPYTIGPMRFTRSLLCMAGRHNPHPTPGNCEGGVHFDIFDIHPYTTGGPTHKGHSDDVELGDLDKLQELLAAADKAGRIHGRFRNTPLWITELSWDSKPPDPGGVPFRILKRWTAEALYRAWSAGIDNFFWFSLDDYPHSPKLPFSETYESGLYYRGATIAEDRPKPNMYAFRFPFVAYSRKDGFYFWGRTPNSKGGRVTIQIRQGRGWSNEITTHADKSGIFEGLAEGSYGRNRHGWTRARYRGEISVPFSLKPVRDFHQAPFGNPVGEPSKSGELGLSERARW